MAGDKTVDIALIIVWCGVSFRLGIAIIGGIALLLHPGLLAAGVAPLALCETAVDRIAPLVGVGPSPPS